MTYRSDDQFPLEMDQKDPLKHYRDKFHIPEHAGNPVLYFTGNSLGLQPKSARNYIEEELNAWKSLGVEGHFEGKRPWFHYHKFSKQALASILGAKESEVVSVNQLTANLHFLFVSFYRPTANRFKILMESGAFPSDQYMVETQVRFHGYDPDEAIIELKPVEGEYR